MRTVIASRVLLYAGAASALVLGCRGPEFVGDSGAGGSGGSTSSTGGQSVGGQGTGGGGDVSVTVSFEDAKGTPIDGAAVLVSEKNGTIVGDAKETGLDGTIVVQAPEGGSVSVLYEEPAGHFNGYSAVVSASTEAIRWIHSSDVGPPTTVPADVTVRVGASAFPDGTTILFSLPCHSSQVTTKAGSLVPVMFSSYQPCEGQPTLDAYAMAIDATGKVIGQSHQSGIAPDSTSILLPEMSTTVEPLPFDVSVTGLPAAHDVYANLRTSVPAGRGLDIIFVNSAPFTEIESTFVPDLDLLAGISDGTLEGVGYYYVHVPGFSGAPLTIAAAPVAAASQPATFDGASSAFELGAGPLGDAVSIRLEGAFARWTLLSSAATSGSVRVPVLPASLEDWKVDAGDAVYTDDIDSLGATSYEDLLKRGVAGVPIDTHDAYGVRWASDRVADF